MNNRKFNDDINTKQWLLLKGKQRYIVDTPLGKP